MATERLLDRRWKTEVQARQLLPENKDKIVEVLAQRLPGRVRFEIMDQGPGFDWKAFMTPSPARLMDNHGRGIFMAKMDSFDTLEYHGTGNRAMAFGNGKRVTATAGFGNLNLARVIGSSSNATAGGSSGTNVNLTWATVIGSDRSATAKPGSTPVLIIGGHQVLPAAAAKQAGAEPAGAEAPGSRR